MLSTSRWSRRYGGTREERGDKIHQSLPPNHPVANLPEPRPLWLWSAAPREDGTEGDLVDIPVNMVGRITFRGHIEEPSNASRAALRRFVRSQRCTEPRNNMYCNEKYRVRLSNRDPSKAVSCSCPDQTRVVRCKHMIAVEMRIRMENGTIGNVPSPPLRRSTRIRRLPTVAEEEGYVFSSLENRPVLRRSTRTRRRPERYGQD